MNKLWVFDLDDTLTENVHDYAWPILDATRFIIGKLGRRAPHVSQIIAMEQDIDSRRVQEINPRTCEEYLFHRDRFPGSLVETYKEICALSGLDPEPEAMTELFKIGQRAFRPSLYRSNVLAGVKKTLIALTARGDRLMLCTKGDKVVQSRKILGLVRQILGYPVEPCDSIDSDNGLLMRLPNDVFELHCIVEDKSADTFRFLRNCSNNKDTKAIYSVGNSFASDIMPALAAGFRGIFIPIETWDTIGKMDEIIAEASEYPKVAILNNISEVIDRYEELG